MNTSSAEGDDKISDCVKTFYEDPPLLFKNFNNGQIKEFTELAVVREFKKNEVIMKESEEVITAYLVLEGSVSVWKDSIQIITLAQGELVGETFIFPDNYRIANVIASVDCTLLCFDRNKVLDFLTHKPRKLTKLLTRNLILIQGSKLGYMNRQLITLKKRLSNNK
jgi:CRP-like cAMP-binding protein